MVAMEKGLIDDVLDLGSTDFFPHRAHCPGTCCPLETCAQALGIEGRRRQHCLLPFQSHHMHTRRNFIHSVNFNNAVHTSHEGKTAALTVRERAIGIDRDD